MPEEKWSQVDDYFGGLFAAEPEFCAAALRATKEAKLPDIAVSTTQGRFLAMMVQISGARRVLEVGTLGGYSALWMAQALPEDGHLITLEYHPVCAGVARANFAHAGLAERIDLRYGEAIDSFKALVGEKLPPFDLVFIDANKPDYPEYLHWALRLSRPGTVIIADNIVRDGGVIDADSDDQAVQGVRAFLEAAAADKRVEMTALQTVGVKGHDGFAVLRVIK